MWRRRNWGEYSIFALIEAWTRTVVAINKDVRFEPLISRRMIYSPHLCAIVVLIRPTCLNLRASPSFLECCIWYPTELSYTEFVLKPVQVTKTRDMSVAYAQGFLERHWNAVKGVIGLSILTSSSLSGVSGLLFTSSNDCHSSKPPHQMSQSIFEDRSARVCSRLQHLHVYNRGPMYCIWAFPNWEGRRHSS